MSNNTHSHDSHEHHHPGPKTFAIVWVLLMILTGITLWVGMVDFGLFDPVVAMTVATVKASLVALYFMHLKFEDKLTWVYAVYPLLLLFLLIITTVIEKFTRVPVY